jgi:hypothetical protein
VDTQRRRDAVAEVAALTDWAPPGGQPEPALTETPAGSRPASSGASKGGKSRPASGASKK